MTCGICGAKESKFVLRQENLPIFQNSLCKTAEQAAAVPRGTLNLRICCNCGFMWNSEAEHGSEDFDPSYESDQTFSPAFSDHVDRMIGKITSSLTKKTVFLEIGAGQGYFLNRLKDAAGKLFQYAYGFDEVWRGEAVADDIKMHQQYFDGASHSLLEHDVDVVICRHVLEYIDRPVDFFKAVRGLFGDKNPGKVYFETRCTDWSVSNNLSEDFCYEECAYENGANLKLALELAGFSNVSIEHVFDGQYLWASGDTLGAPTISSFDQSEYIEQALTFGENITLGIKEYQTLISDLNADGKTALWGASTKGVTLATTVDPDGTLLTCLIDMSPHKQDTYVPASGQIIVSPQEAAKLGVKNIFLSNARYKDEIEEYIASEGLPFTVCERQN